MFICPEKTHGKDEFLQAVQVLHTQFLMFGTFVTGNVEAGGSAFRKIVYFIMQLSHTRSLAKGVTIWVRLQSGESVLVVIKTQFGPDLILRNFREKIRRIASTGHVILGGWG